MILSIAHFVWYGPTLPYLHALAIRSAATHGGFGSVRLHHSDALEELPHVVALHDLPNVEFVALDDLSLCEAAAGAKLAELCNALESPVARSNLVRTALVYRDGGVYLDMDTLTVRSFDAVRATAPGFLGRRFLRKKKGSDRGWRRPKATRRRRKDMVVRGSCASTRVNGS